MTISPDFEAAYGGLLELVGQISRTEVPPEISQGVFGEKVDEWKHADCRGAATLAEAAIKVLQYELSSRGLKEGAKAVVEDLQALGHAEATMGARTSSGDTGQGGKTEIVEVPLPKQLQQKMPNGRGFRMDEFQIIFEPGEADGPPHVHLSIFHPRRYPAFEELQAAARAPGGHPPNLWALVPGPDQEHSIASKTVHLYVLPPEDLLGRGQGRE